MSLMNLSAFLPGLSLSLPTALFRKMKDSVRAEQRGGGRWIGCGLVRGMSSSYWGWYLK